MDTWEGDLDILTVFMLIAELVGLTWCGVLDIICIMSFSYTCVVGSHFHLGEERVHFPPHPKMRWKLQENLNMECTEALRQSRQSSKIKNFGTIVNSF